MKLRNDLIAALDIGTSKMCCLIARPEDDGKLRVIGMGHHASKGIKGGAVVDMEAAEAAIASVVQSAERMAGATIREVVTSLSGVHPTSRIYNVEVEVAGHEVSSHDIQRIFAQGQSLFNGEERQIIHSLPVTYRIDDSRGIRDPRGMYGERLGADIHVVAASPGAVRNLSTCISRCHLDIESFVVSPLASGLATLVDDERELGTILIDMGGGTTTVAVFLDGQVVFSGGVAIGGDHVTSDIARGLSTPRSYAERLKTLYGSAIPSPLDGQETLDIPQVGDEEAPGQQVPKSLLTGIIRPRVEETLELVRACLKDKGLDRFGGRRVVLTGGAAQLHGVPELAGSILDRQVRIGRPRPLPGLAESMAGPAFATCAGLLIHATTDTEPMVYGLPDEESDHGLLGRLGVWLRENF